MSIQALIDKQLSQLFSASGVAGVAVSSDATLHLRQQGSYNPATGSVTAGNYYNPSTGTFTGSDSFTVKVIQRQERAYNKTSIGSATSEIEGKDVSLNLLMQPLTNIVPSQLVGVRLDYDNRTFGILSVNITRLGNRQLVWEVSCQ